MRRSQDTEKVNAAEESSADARRPYEAPRVLLKRSVAAATLLTSHGPMSSGLTASG
jgi:hypothetical protein